MSTSPPVESTPLPDDRELVGRAAHGDRQAFGQLYQRHVRPVYWQTYAVVRNDLDAEDATQEVFITTWKKLAAITIVDGSLLPWLLVTARYTALNKRRKTLRDETRRKELDGDLTYAEAAAHLGVTHGAVRNRVSRE